MSIFADSSFFLSVIGGDSHTKAATTALAKYEGHFCSTALVTFESGNRIHKWSLDGKFDQSEAKRLEFSECARQHGLTRGTIYGERRAGVVRLAFSREIPLSTQQSFRNIWSQFS
jgi:hypothetical protein